MDRLHVGDRLSEKQELEVESQLMHCLVYKGHPRLINILASVVDPTVWQQSKNNHENWVPRSLHKLLKTVADNFVDADVAPDGDTPKDV